MFRYYPAMPGNSTCHVQEKEQLQRGIMPDRFFNGSQDRTCPVTTISSLMEKHGICQVDLLKVQPLFLLLGEVVMALMVSRAACVQSLWRGMASVQ